MGDDKKAKREELVKEIDRLDSIAKDYENLRKVKEHELASLEGDAPAGGDASKEPEEVRPWT